MLSKRYRLPSELLSHFSGTKFPGKNLMVIAIPSTLSIDRVATIISNKVFPLAHDRHALKRLLHESLHLSVDVPPHFDLLIIAHAQKPLAPLPDFATELDAIIKNLKS